MAHKNETKLFIRIITSFIESGRVGLIALSLILIPGIGSAQNQGPDKQVVAAEKTDATKQRIVREGVAVEFSIAGASSEKGKPAELMEGEDALVRFKITDAATGVALTGLRPAVWMNGRTVDKPAEGNACRDLVQSFMQGSLRNRPDVDLNAYYILALNKEPNISVIDPLLGLGTSKLITLVMLESPGADWVLLGDGKKLFVTMPLAHRVAVIDTATWKVAINIDVEGAPTRLAVQPDGKYLWVASDAEQQGGVTVIDVTSMQKVARIATGAGHHELAFTSDDRYAFVTNSQDGALSVIDIRQLKKVKDIRTGRRPSAMAFSSLSKAVYVTDEVDGTITVINAESHEILARLTARPGIKTVRFDPSGRYGFATNQKEDAVYIFDAATNRLLQTVPVENGPNQISFTSTFAYIRSAGAGEVKMIRLSAVAKGEPADISRFPGGQKPPGLSSDLAFADVIVPAPEPNSVLVANPADQAIYYYMEGMLAPMGSFNNYRREPKAVLIVDRSLRERGPGEYSALVKLPRSGKYDVAFLLDSPRVIHCFSAEAKSNPELAKKRPQAPLRVESLLADKRIKVGEKLRLRFKLTDPATNEPKAGLRDVRILTFLAPGVWQKRQWAESVGDGVYESEITAPEAGVYYVFFECPSLKVAYVQLPYLVLQAQDAASDDKTATSAGQNAQQSKNNR
jgi:YVTN family beta-propeller protein